MQLGEFDLIGRYFRRSNLRDDVALGVGDDAALLEVGDGNELVVSVDTLISGVHFVPDVDPTTLGHRVLAVNLSDMAAMGASPCWATLALSLPDVDEAWLAAFADGLFELAHAHGVDLVGGDTVRGPLSITVQIMGQVPSGEALRRSGAMPSDKIYVTGTLGMAALALRLRQSNQSVPEELAAKLDVPAPRIAIGQALRGIASACIDVSDGLVADLGHIIDAARCGALLSESSLPLVSSPPGSLTDEDCLDAALFGGDDYELCYTVPVDRVSAIPADVLQQSTCIGEVDKATGVRLVGKGGDLVPLKTGGGYRHF